FACRQTRDCGYDLDAVIMTYVYIQATKSHFDSCLLMARAGSGTGDCGDSARELSCLL
ncbi:hypothetical protein BgiMline_001023, partial [Biomphalaria glabrata]